MRSDTVAEISRMFTAGAHRTKFTEVQRREPRTDPDTGVDVSYWHLADIEGLPPIGGKADIQRTGHNVRF